MLDIFRGIGVVSLLVNAQRERVVRRGSMWWFRVLSFETAIFI